MDVSHLDGGIGKFETNENYGFEMIYAVVRLGSASATTICDRLLIVHMSTTLWMGEGVGGPPYNRYMNGIHELIPGARVGRVGARY